jgi:peptide deformylase
MTVLEVVDYLANPVPLRRRARPVDEKEIYEDPFCAFVRDLRDTLVHYNALGLAATQVLAASPDGEPWAVFVMRDISTQGIHVFVNPVVAIADGPMVVGSEGCLSFRSVQWPVRCKPIASVTGLDDDWKPKNLRVDQLTPLEACCIQHEAEHLSGRCMLDRLHRGERQAFLRKVGKAKRLEAPPKLPAPACVLCKGRGTTGHPCMACGVQATLRGKPYLPGISR